MSTKRILVIDDEPNVSTLVQLYLARLGGYEVLTENLPSQARNSALRFNPDMILLDVNMPGKDGGQVAREFRADPALCHVPILFLTSLVSSAEAGKRDQARHAILSGQTGGSGRSRERRRAHAPGKRFERVLNSAALMRSFRNFPRR